jgi:ABC-type transport system involved in multi-copper enzyme maturation permease subunit
MLSPTEQLLKYRPWRGEFRPPSFASVAMARASLQLMFRRKLFWALYALAMLIFFFFFYGQYLVVWIELQTSNQSVVVGGLPIRVGDLTGFLKKLNLNGTPHTFGNFIWFEGYIAMIVLALAGAVLVGNDFHFGSLPFYLAKPIGKRHYVLGKCLGIAAFVNLVTTIPALILYIQAGLLYDWKTYYLEHIPLLLGILAYGLVLTVTLSMLLVATSVWVRRTVPLIMVWSGLFVLCRVLGGFLVDGQQFDARWRLIDIWNDTYLVGLWFLGADRDPKFLGGGSQPDVWEAALVLVGIVIACGVYLRKRIQAVEVVS